MRVVAGGIDAALGLGGLVIGLKSWYSGGGGRIGGHVESRLIGYGEASLWNGGAMLRLWGMRLVRGLRMGCKYRCVVESWC